jgi:L-2-hydroxyglutarate oxidase
MTSNHDVVVVGAGILGLATAMRLLAHDRSLRLVVIEKENGIARHQTGNNSGVIHAGLYYRPGSLKAQLCRDGYRQLIEFCRAESVPHEICGKMVVATSEPELERLHELHGRGVANGLAGIEWLSPSDIKAREPHCIGMRALVVPETGIVDYGIVAAHYGRCVERNGGSIALGEKVVAIRESNGALQLRTSTGIRHCRLLITCAGLQSDRLARMTQKDLPLRILPFRGEYYELVPEARSLVRHLIYPVPDPAFPFLGVHFTRMIGGGVECGPNAVFAFGREAYGKFAFNLRDTMESLSWPGFHSVARRYWRTGLGEFHRSFRKAAFVKALQRLIPTIRSEHLRPGGAGIRAQACSRDGKLLDDFYFLEAERQIHVCNAPSPAATASLAIGSVIADMARKRLS